MLNADPKLRRRVGAFRHCTRGTAAIEFAFVAPAYLGLLVGTTALGFDYAETASADAAVVGISRQLSEGGGSNWNLDKMVASFCDQSLWSGQCSKENVIIRVGTADNPGFENDLKSFVNVQSGQTNIISIVKQTSLLSTLTGTNVSLGSAYAVYVP